MSKYQPLWEYLNQENKDHCRMTFEEMEDILGFAIDHSFLTYKKEAKEYGYETVTISMKEKTVTFGRIS